MDNLHRFTLKLAGICLTTCALLSIANTAAAGPAAVQTPDGYVCTHNPNGKLMVRSGPGRNYGAVSALKSGKPVSVLGQTGGGDDAIWLNVKHRKVVGWVRYDYVCGFN